MTAANTAMIYAAGCGWAGIPATRTLLIDMDFEAPGIHYYDFAHALAAAPSASDRYSYAVADRQFDSFSTLLDWIRRRPRFGFLQWLNDALEVRGVRETLNKFLPDTYRASSPIMSQELLVSVRTRLLHLLGNAKRGSDGALDLHQHIISILDAAGDVVLGVLPAGEPQQPHYQQKLRTFNWRSFFDNAGYAVLSALYEFLLTSPSHGYARILLDQNAGETLPSIANRKFAHSRVVVTGFNQQNQDGLIGLLQDDSLRDARDDVRVVLSQYTGRQLASGFQAEPISGTISDPIVNYTLFAHEEARRNSLLNLLEEVGIRRDHTALVDFVPDAVQREHFHRPGSASWNELARMLVSMEKTDPGVNTPFQHPPEVRLLGEFVGVDEEKPSGALGALRAWLAERLPHTSVGGIATEHEFLAEMVQRDPEAASDEPACLPPADRLRVAIREFHNGGQHLALSNFDIVAIPAYLLLHVCDRVEVLDLDGIQAHAEDRMGPVDLDYLRQSILGFDRYGHAPTQSASKPIAYPLFVDFQLLSVNRERIVKDDFKKDYFWREQRRFRGFPDPADVLAAARAAKENDVPLDRLIMTLERRHIAQWYEWQTIIALFGGKDFDIRTPWDDPELCSRLTSKETVRATRFYLELSTYASKDSNTTSWDKAIKLFFSDRQVGMAFVFPDAIPLQYRTSTPATPFSYARLPRHDIVDESSAPYPEECWLLVVPKNRRPGAPSHRVLTQLLVEFLCVQNQRRYQELGGLTCHRRVLECVDLWTSSPFLPLLSQDDAVPYSTVRMCSYNARKIAREIVTALDDLHQFVDQELGKHRTRDTSTDYLWHKPDFIELIENKVAARFAAIAPQSPTTFEATAIQPTRRE
jgi:hypothetical protein